MADQIEILIKTTAELAGAKAAADSLERQIGQAKALGKEYKDMEAQMARARSTIAQYENAQGSGGLFASLKGMSWGTITAGVAGLGTAIKYAKDAVAEFAQEERQLVKLDTALKNAGQSTSEYKNRLGEMAEELSKATATDHTEWLAVFARLTQFGADSGNIGAATDAVKNLSGLLGGDLQTSAMLVSKALQGNFQMFARYGIVVKDASTQTEKLNELFKMLAERGGGQMEAMAETLTGKWSGLKIAFDDSLLAVGRFIGESGALQKSLELLTFVFNGLEDAIGKPMRKLPELSDIADANKVSMTEAAGGAEKYAKAVKAISDNASTALEAMKKLSDEENKDKSHADKMDDLQKQFELGKVDIMGKSGALSPLGVIAAKAAIEQRFADIKSKREQDMAAAEQARAQQTLKDTDAQIEKDIARSEQLEKMAVIAERIKKMQVQESAASEMSQTGGQLAPHVKAVADLMAKNGITRPEDAYAEYRLSLSKGDRAGLPESYSEFQGASGRSAEVATLYRDRLRKQIAAMSGQLGGMTPDQAIAANSEDAATAPTRMGLYTKSKTGAGDAMNDSWRRYRESRDLQTGDTANRGLGFMGSTMNATAQQEGMARYELNQMKLNVNGTLREFTDAIRLYNETLETARRQIKNGGGNR